MPQLLVESTPCTAENCRSERRRPCGPVGRSGNQPVETRRSTVAVLCAGSALNAVAAILFYTPPGTPPIDDSPQLIRPADHIQFQRGVAVVDLWGLWHTFPDDVQILQQLPDLKRIVIVVNFSREAERNVRDVYLKELEREFPNCECELFFWNGSY